jgi:FlaA1/EpsC-like NDP-sugar epimerase
MFVSRVSSFVAQLSCGFTSVEISLSRPAVLDTRLLMKNPFTGRNVLLAGAGDSIGSALAKAILAPLIQIHSGAL